MEMKNNMTVAASGMVIAAILVGSFFAINTAQQAIASGNATILNNINSLTIIPQQVFGYL